MIFTPCTELFTSPSRVEELVTIRLSEVGPFLGGRPLAVALRERVLGAIAASDNVVVDLTGVQAMSPSFADELFGKLDPALWANQRIRLTGEPGLTAMVQVMVQRRASAG